MALFDENSDARTERPTDRRRRQARERGQVAHSVELLIAARLLATWMVLIWWFVKFATSASSSLRAAFEQVGSSTLPPSTTLLQLQDHAWLFLASANLPLVIVTSAILLTHFGQVGWLWRWENATPQHSRLSPITGLQRLLALGTIGRALKLTLKLTVSVTAIGFILLSNLPLTSVRLSPDVTGQLAAFGSTAVRLASFVAMTMLTFGAFDYMWQRWNFERSLQMTKDELREELKESEGDARLKSHRETQARQVTRSPMPPNLRSTSPE